MMSSSTLTSLQSSRASDAASTLMRSCPGHARQVAHHREHQEQHHQSAGRPLREGHRELLAPPAPIGPQHVRHCGQRQDDQHGDGVEAQRTDNVTVQQIVSRPQASAEGQSVR